MTLYMYIHNANGETVEIVAYFCVVLYSDHVPLGEASKRSKFTLQPGVYI